MRNLSNPAQTLIMLFVFGILGFAAYTFLWSPSIPTVEEIVEVASDPRSSLRRIDDMLGDRPRSILKRDNGEPAFIKVQHCLIGFNGSIDDKTIARTREEARALAHELLQQAKDGANFEEMIEKYTDDSPPGIYQMANAGFPGNMAPTLPSKKVFSRYAMMERFGDVGFSLEVGEFGIAEHHPAGSKFGWHIIKRIE